MNEKYYITTPIYYVNDRPHIGHSYTTIAADVLARYQSSTGRDVYFLTGTDEHGIKICNAAAECNVTPGELADEVVVHFRKLWERLDIRYDDFIRTSQDRHRRRVQILVERLLQRGEIYLGKYDGWYDETEEEYVTENTARENDYNSQISGRPLVRHSEEGYFFRLSRWVPRLLEYIETHPDFILPVPRRNEVISKLKLGVEDLCISREASKLMNWGIPMPNDHRHSVYVWIDALSNYITALGYPPIDDGEKDFFNKYWPVDVHLIGKDILWFHAVYWPCLLMALELPLPITIFAHGWWMNMGKKMSKSLGNFISNEYIEEICNDYSVDYYRYFLLRSVKFGDDGNFSADRLIETYNTELANGIGNLLSRTVKMIEKYRSGMIAPLRVDDAGPEEREVIAGANQLIRLSAEYMDKFELQSYINEIIKLETTTNRYIEKTQPFKLAKDDSKEERLSEILSTCAEAVRIILLYLSPIMPEKSAQGLKMLGVESRDGRGYNLPPEWGAYRWDRPVRKGVPLFPKKKIKDVEQQVGDKKS